MQDTAISTFRRGPTQSHAEWTSTGKTHQGFCFLDLRCGQQSKNFPGKCGVRTVAVRHTVCQSWELASPGNGHACSMPCPDSMEETGFDIHLLAAVCLLACGVGRACEGECVCTPPPSAGGSTKHSPQDSICTQEQQQRSEQRQNLKHPSPSGSGSGSRTACLLSDKAGHKALSRQLCTDLAVSAGNVWAWDKGAGNVSYFHLGLWQQCGGAVIRASRPAGACSVTLSMGSLSRGP